MGKTVGRANNEVLAGKIKDITRGTKHEVTKRDALRTLTSVKDAVLELIEDGYNEITVPGVVTFDTIVKESYEARNPKTQEAVQVPTRLRLKINGSSALKNKVKEIPMAGIAKTEEKIAELEAE